MAAFATNYRGDDANGSFSAWPLIAGSLAPATSDPLPEVVA
jgi:hypothetical protein